MSFDPIITAERDRCVRAIQTRTGSSRITLYQKVLDDFIKWSLLRPQLRHEAHHAGGSAQDTFKFVLVENGQVFWEVFPRDDDGAKIVAFPQKTAEYPESVRSEVRRQWGAIDSGKENSGTGEARLSLPLLFHEPALLAAQAALDRALTSRTGA